MPLQRFNGFSTYWEYCDDLLECPREVIDRIKENIDFDPNREGFVAAAWLYMKKQTLFSLRGRDQDPGNFTMFLLVTEQRVVSRKAIAGLEQVRFRDVVGVERSALIGNVKVLAPGNFSTCFDAVHYPPNKLIDMVFEVINSQWHNVRNDSISPSPPEPADIFVQIERLGELRDKNVISADDFEKKKAELLSRI